MNAQGNTLTWLSFWQQASSFFHVVLQVTLQSQGCATQSGAALSTMKTASPRPLSWLTRPDMCRFSICSVFYVCVGVWSQTHSSRQSGSVMCKGDCCPSLWKTKQNCCTVSVCKFILLRHIFPLDLYVKWQERPFSRLAFSTLTVNILAFVNFHDLFIEHIPKSTRSPPSPVHILQTKTYFDEVESWELLPSLK